jgi:hypothetical protein
MRVNYACSSILESMTEDEKAAIPPRYDPDSKRVQETFNIDGDHFWVESWGVMEARQLLLEMHGPSSSMKDPSNKRYFICQHYGYKGQKHRLNLHRHHGLNRAEAVKGIQLKSYPTIPWADPILSMRSLSRCRTADDILKMFRDVKLRSLKKTIGGASASVADSLATFERTEKLPKKTIESEAQSWPPKKTIPIGGTRKRGHKTTGEKVARVESPSSSSDSFSGSTTAPPCPTGTPVTEEDFSGDDVDKLAAGRSKRKKVDEDDLA